MKIIGVIPARLHSTRLPGKVLLDIAGKPLLWHVYHSALKSSCLDSIVVAADDEKIVSVMESYHIPCMLTSKKHKSGTERAGEVALKMKADAYINIQGDEPMIAASNIDMIARKFETDKRFPIVTLKVRIRSQKDVLNTNNVKVVTDREGRALYFSRSVIPYDRDKSENVRYFKHLGIYGYTRQALLKIVRLAQTDLEISEKLEQLRFMEHGFPISVLETKKGSIGVDTAEDLEHVRKMMIRK